MKKVRNKLLLIGPILSSITILTLSASCVNSNKEEEKPENPVTPGEKPSNPEENGNSDSNVEQPETPSNPEGNNGGNSENNTETPVTPEETPSNSSEENEKSENTSEDPSTNQPEISNPDENIQVVSNYVYDKSEKALEYYAPLEGLTGEELFNALVKLQWSKANDTSKNYGNLPSFYNNTSAFKDLYYENDKTILDVYSENPSGVDPYTFATYNFKGGKNEGDGTNREHVIPQSWFKKLEPIRSDAQFVWPTDIKVNNIRSNYPHGEVVKVSETSQNGSKLGTNSNGETVFEPIDEFKGDIARCYLYFAVTYAEQNIYVSNEVFSKNTVSHLSDEYLKLYLKWNNNDPVDLFDINRNNEIYNSYRAVRNPFIDYPELEKCLFEGQKFTNKGLLIKLNK